MEAVDKHTQIAEKVKQKALEYAAQGWRVIPIHTPTAKGCSCGKPNCRAVGKHPRIEGWADDATTDAETISGWFDQWPNTNVGIAFGAQTGLVDIEVDPRNNGDTNIKALERIFGALPTTLAFRSGGGGIHRLYQYPVGHRVRTTSHIGKEHLGTKMTGVDIRSDGGQSVMPPSAHVSGKRYVWIDQSIEPTELPDKWIAFLSEEEDTSEDAATHFLLNGPAQLDDITLDMAREVLTHCSPDCDHDEWVVIGQALKLQFPIDEEEAFTIFNDWSALSDEKYPGEEQVRYQWEHFGGKANRKPVTFRSVLKIACANGYRAPTKVGSDLSPDERTRIRKEDARLLRMFTKEFQEALSDDELALICERVRAAELFNVTRELLQDEYAAAFEKIHPSKKLTAKSAKEMLSDEGERERRAREMAEHDGWYAPFIYIQEGPTGAFYNKDNSLVISPKVFDDTYAAKLVTPVRRAQGIIAPLYMPSDLVLNCELIEKAAGLRYVPGEQLLFNKDGATWVNTYQPSNIVPKDPMLWTKEESAAIKTIERHLNWMLGEEHALIMRQFLAYVKQQTGKRVRWCYTIIGPKGIGKSFIGNMSRAILGRSNVKDIGQATLSHTSFNGWAAGAQLNVIEELKVDGVKKWEIMNSLKAAITNDVIDVHKKGKDNTNVDATASFIAFTNHENAIAIEAGDRRYFVAHTKFHSVAGFLADLGGRTAARLYFTRLFGLLDRYPEAIAGWLEDTNIDSFDPARAPESEEGHQLVQASMSDQEAIVRGVIESGEYATVNDCVIELRALKAALMVSEESFNMSAQGLGRLLRDIGYTSVRGFEFEAIKGRKSRWFVSVDGLRERGIKWDSARDLDIIRDALAKVSPLLPDMP